MRFFSETRPAVSRPSVEIEIPLGADRSPRRLARPRCLFEDDRRASQLQQIGVSRLHTVVVCCTALTLRARARAGVPHQAKMLVSNAPS